MSFSFSMSQNSATCAHNHMVTLLFTCSSSWNFWWARCFFKCECKMKSLGARSELWAGLYKTSQLKLHNCCTALVVWVLALSSQTLHVRIPLSSVLNCTSRPFQCFKICCSICCGPLRHKINKKNPLLVPEDSCQDFLGWGCFVFLFCGRVSVVPLLWLLFAFRCEVKQSCFILYHYRVKNSSPSSE